MELLRIYNISLQSQMRIEELKNIHELCSILRLRLDSLKTLIAMLVHDRKIGGLYKSLPCLLPTIIASNILITGLPKITLHTAAKQDVCAT